MSLPSFTEAKQYLDDPHACFQLMTLSKHMTLSPKYIGNVSQGVSETLDAEMSQYSDTLEGVMIAYDNVQILQNAGVIFEELPQLHFDIKFDVIVFKPTIGSILKGIVNKLGEQHIGCLVHNCFNASISKPINTEMNDWEGFKLALGEQFFFQVTDVSGHNGLIFIRGTLSESSLSVISKGKKRKKHKESTDVNDGNMRSLSKKHKRKHSHRISDLGSESPKSIIQLDSESSICDTPLKENKFHEFKVTDADGFVGAVACRASELLAGLTAQHNHKMASSDSDQSSLFSKQSAADAEENDIVMKVEEGVSTEVSPKVKRAKHKKSKHSSKNSVMSTANMLSEFQIKLEPKDEFSDDTPRKHKKHKKTRRSVNESLFSDDSMMYGSSEHTPSTVMVDCKREVQDQGLHDTPRKHKKRKKSSKDLNHSSFSEMDITYDSDSVRKQSIMSDIKMESPDDVSETRHKKHKKKSKRQTQTFTQHEFL